MVDENGTEQATPAVPTVETGTPADQTAGQEAVEAQTPEALAEGEGAAVVEPEKQFTQGELEAEIGKRLARQERKLKRELTASAEPEPLQIESSLNPDDFATTDAYVDALATEKAEAILSQRQTAKQSSAIEESYLERAETAMDKYPDFEAVAYNPDIRITGEMAEAIKVSEQGPELAYYLGSNPKEALRIADLSPVAQVRELTLLEAKVGVEKPPVSNVPDPIKPLHGNASTTTKFETTDPRSTGQMSATEWIEADRARRAKLFSAKGYK